METIKWAMSIILGGMAAILGVGLGIAAMFFSVAVQLVGGIVLLAGFITVYIKERFDSRSDK
jgi:hypothetical protein